MVRSHLASIAVLMVFAGVASPARAAPAVSLVAPAAVADPCNFTTAPAYDVDQVLACFRSVPFCPDPTNAATCDRDAQVNHLRAAIEGFSDLRDTYDATSRWRAQLNRISKAAYRSDYDLYADVARLMRSFRDPHWAYTGPGCYESTIFGIIPLEFASATTQVDDSRRQIVYLREPIPFFASLYAAGTGVDVTQYTGQRVVLLNGEPPLQFFRRWGRENLQQDADDSLNLMVIQDNLGYTFRAGSFNSFPESRSITLTLETRDGKRTRVELPWAMVPFGQVFGGPLPASTAEFRDLCFAPSGAAATSTAGSSRAQTLTLREPMAMDDRLMQRRDWFDFARSRPATAQQSVQPTTAAVFTEVPPEQLNQNITEIFPLKDGARTVAFGNDTVAVQIRTDFIENWDDEVAAGATYACENADRLILDVRGNGGGFVSRAQSLVRYLNATSPAIPDSIYAFRELAFTPPYVELRSFSEQLVGLGFPECIAGYEARCHVSVPSGQLVTDANWFRKGPLERRGRSIEAVTPLTTFATIVPPEARVIPCGGKFVGKKLIVLVNGVNGSAGYFAPQSLARTSTIVALGGYAREPMVAGRAHGGPVVSTLFFQQDQDALRDILGVEVKNRLPDLPRPVDFRIEAQGFYRPDLRRLSADEPQLAEVRVPFWSNTVATDGAAYRAAVSTVERRAEVDPFCAPLAKIRACGLYEGCAKRALDAAVRRGVTSTETAARTLEDATAECRLPLE
jgi:hypothetical protein